MTSQTAFERFTRRRYFDSLDGLRCLAIAPVIWHHSTPRPYPGFAGRGHLGVELFFSISGFLITTLLLRERRQSGTIALRAFYGRRVRRIFPLYYVVLAFTMLFALFVLPASDPQRAHFFRSLPAYATYTANWFVDFGVAHAILFAFSWSLATEEQFYLLWPPLLKKLGRTSLLAAMTTAVVVDVLAEHGALRPFGLGGLPLRMLTSFNSAIGIGAIAAIVVDCPTGFRLVWPLLGRKWSAPVAFAVVIAMAATWVLPFWAFCVALAALVVACSIRPDHGLRPIADAGAVRHVGRVSYGMYLMHVAVIGSIRALWPALRERPMVVFPVAFAISVGLATLSYHHFEQRFRLRRAAAAVPAVSASA